MNFYQMFIIFAETFVWMKPSEKEDYLQFQYK